MLVGVTVSQLRAVVQVFIDKLEQSDWLTAHISADLHVPIEQSALKHVDQKFVEFARSKPLEEVLQHLEDLIATAGGFCQSDYPKDLRGPLATMLSSLMLLEGEENDALHSLFEGVRVQNVVPAIKLMRKKLRILRRQASTKEWVEDGAELREFPITIVCKDKPLGIMYDDDLTVTRVSDGAGLVAGVEEGMRIVAIGEHRVCDRQGADQALNTVGDVFEISVEVEAAHDELERAGTSVMYEKHDEEEIGMEREVTWSALLMEARESDSFCEGFPRSGSSIEASKLPRMDSMGAAVPLSSRSGLPRSQSQSEAKELESRLRHEKHEKQDAGLGERQESSGLGERQDSALDDVLRRQKHELERREAQEEAEHGEMEDTIKQLKAEKEARRQEQEKSEAKDKKLMAFENKVKMLEEKLQADEAMIENLKNACTAQKDELESQKVARQREADSDMPDFD